MNEIILYDYWRSTASYRVRIALGLAGIEWQTVSIDLLKGDQREPPHRARNPLGFVPVLEVDGQRFTQSLAIVEYLNTTRRLGLLPESPVKKAKVQALAHAIAMDIHPVCNLSVVSRATAGEEPVRTQWMQHFIKKGLDAFEIMLSDFEQAPYCTGETPCLADLCLIPQLYNADRWVVDYAEHSRIASVAIACDENAAFVAAKPTPR